MRVSATIQPLEVKTVRTHQQEKRGNNRNSHIIAAAAGMV